jgi:acyl-CoA synthetase (NDP forming)
VQELPTSLQLESGWPGSAGQMENRAALTQARQEIIAIHHRRTRQRVPGSKLGGRSDHVEPFADSAVRLHPLSRADAAEMVNGLKGVRLLRGFRGGPPADEGALQDVLLRVSALLELCPEIVEMDVNPLIVLESGAIAVDVRIRVQREQPRATTRRVAY